MSITISRSVPADSEAGIRVAVLALASDPVMQATYLHPMNADEVDEYVAWRLRLMGSRMLVPEWHGFKAVEDSTGRILATCALIAPSKKPAGQVSKPEETPKVGDRYAGAPTFMNQPVLDNMDALMTAARKKHISDESNVWYLRGMFVHPEYQGRGIGSRMLKQVCEVVDAANGDCYLEASSVGVPVYRKAGFEVLEVIPMLEGRDKTTTMLRPARGQAPNGDKSSEHRP